MLMVAPSGIVKLETLGWTPSFCRAVAMVTGIDALELAMEKANKHAWRIFLINMTGLRPDNDFNNTV
jgi:hypothetical protein